jgi:hypothetical protein
LNPDLEKCSPNSAVGGEYRRLTAEDVDSNNIIDMDGQDGKDGKSGH